MAMARVRGPGEPNRVCDLVASSIVEEYVRRDPAAKLDIRVSGGHGVIFVAGDVASTADFDVSAVVRRTLGQCGVTAPIEPFIALEPMAPAWASAVGSRVPLTVFGYATGETTSFLPPAVDTARRSAFILERKRTNDPEGFWIGSNYEMTVSRHGSEWLLNARVEHVQTKALAEVRSDVQGMLESIREAMQVRVNVAGEELASGFAHRIGSSHALNPMDRYGSQLPSSDSGVGCHLSHPLNVGSWMARAVARELVQEGKGRAVSIHVSWLPLEERPSAVKVRNELGKDLSAHVDSMRFSLAHIPEAYQNPALGTLALRAMFDGSVTLPWEV